MNWVEQLEERSFKIRDAANNPANLIIASTDGENEIEYGILGISYNKTSDAKAIIEQQQKKIEELKGLFKDVLWISERGEVLDVFKRKEITKTIENET